MEQNGIRITGDRNPAAKIERYREGAPDIRFFSLEQIDQQLKSLEEYPDLQVMVAFYVYARLDGRSCAGCRRVMSIFRQVYME